MKKTKNAPVEQDEEETTQPHYNPESAMKKWLMDYQKKQVDSALKRVGLKHSGGGNPAKGKPAYGSSISSKVDEELEAEFFSMMDGMLAEKIVSILEEGKKPKIDPANMISPDAKLSGKTPVVASADGIPPTEYAQAQGVVGKFKPSMSESKGSEEEHHIDRRMYAMEVPYSQKDKAKAEGMSWHPKKKVWYHRTLVAASMSKFKRSSSKAEPI